jgi:excisionase family DNA binding protein
MNDLLLSTIPYAEFQLLIANTVQTAVQLATAHLLPKENEEFLTRKQTATILGISLVTLNEWTKEGKIKGYRIGSRVRYKRNEIEQSLLIIKIK